MNNKVLYIILLITLFGCSPRIKTKVISEQDPFPPEKEVLVIWKNEAVPVNSIQVGTIKIGDSGFTTDCGWEKVISDAKKNARLIGGNLLKITRHTPPAASSCDRIEAAVYRLSDEMELQKIRDSKSTFVDSTWNYCKIYVYRPGGPGALVGYNLNLNDSVICRVKNFSAQEIILNEEGFFTLMAKTETSEELKIKLQHGHSYYLQCSLTLGAMIGRPRFRLVDPAQGKMEYEMISKRKTPK